MKTGTSVVRRHRPVVDREQAWQEFAVIAAREAARLVVANWLRAAPLLDRVDGHGTDVGPDVVAGLSSEETAEVTEAQ